MRKIRFVFVTVGLIVAITCLTVTFNSDWIKVGGMDVTLSSSSHQAQLFRRIKNDLEPKLQHFQGRYFWQVPLKEVRQLVLADKRVLAVDVYREFPSNLKIEITPHTPVMVFLDGGGRFHPIAMDGAMLPPTAPAQAKNLAVLRGAEFASNSDLREQAIQLFQMMPERGLMDKQNVSEIFYSAKDGFEMFLSDFDSEIKIGKTDFGPKLSRVQKVLSYLNSRHIKGRVIDARFSKKVVVRVRNTP